VQVVVGRIAMAVGKRVDGRSVAVLEPVKTE
jgi:hypothetical protein